MKSISKIFRHRAMVDIISQGSVPNQIALGLELQKRGFEVTQATISRDIKELGLLKTKRGYRKSYEAHLGGHGIISADARLTLKRTVTDVIKTSNIVIVKTAVGCAQPVAFALDSGDYEEVLGTIGGDDTVFAIAKSGKDALSLKSKILNNLR